MVMNVAVGLWRMTAASKKAHRDFSEALRNELPQPPHFPVAKGLSAAETSQFVVQSAAAQRPQPPRHRHAQHAHRLRGCLCDLFAHDLKT